MSTHLEMMVSNLKKQFEEEKQALEDIWTEKRQLSNLSDVASTADKVGIDDMFLF